MVVESLCDSVLVGGSVGVIVAAPVFDDQAGSNSESRRHELISSSPSLPLNDSIQAFCHGEPRINEKRI